MQSVTVVRYHQGNQTSPESQPFQPTTSAHAQTLLGLFAKRVSHGIWPSGHPVVRGAAELKTQKEFGLRLVCSRVPGTQWASREGWRERRGGALGLGGGRCQEPREQACLGMHSWSWAPQAAGRWGFGGRRREMSKFVGGWEVQVLREELAVVCIGDLETLGSSLLQSGLQCSFCCCFERRLMIVANIYCVLKPQILPQVIAYLSPRSFPVKEKKLTSLKILWVKSCYSHFAGKENETQKG